MATWDKIQNEGAGKKMKLGEEKRENCIKNRLKCIKIISVELKTIKIFTPPDASWFAEVW